MSWVRPDWEILPRPSTHTSECSTDSGMVVVSQKLGRKYRTNRVLNLGPVLCKSSSLSYTCSLCCSGRKSSEVKILNTDFITHFNETQYGIWSVHVGCFNHSSVCARPVPFGKSQLTYLTGISVPSCENALVY